MPLLFMCRSLNQFYLIVVCFGGWAAYGVLSSLSVGDLNMTRSTHSPTLGAFTSGSCPMFAQRHYRMYLVQIYRNRGAPVDASPCSYPCRNSNGDWMSQIGGYMSREKANFQSGFTRKNIIHFITPVTGGYLLAKGALAKWMAPLLLDCVNSPAG